MGWKDWSYARKGGIIFVVIGLLMNLLTYLLMNLESPPLPLAFVGMIFSAVPAFFGLILSYIVLRPFCSSTPSWPMDSIICPNFINIIAYVLIIIFSTMVYFLIGALIGVIVGIIKKKSHY